MSNKTLEKDCVDIIKELMRRNACLQPANENFDVWNKGDAVEIVNDLINLIISSDELLIKHHKNDFGK